MLKLLLLSLFNKSVNLTLNIERKKERTIKREKTTTADVNHIRIDFLLLYLLKFMFINKNGDIGTTDKLSVI